MISHDTLIAATRSANADAIELLIDAQKYAAHNMPKAVVAKLKKAEEQLALYRQSLLVLMADEPRQGQPNQTVLPASTSASADPLGRGFALPPV